jgi:hypothetical protein
MTTVIEDDAFGTRNPTPTGEDSTSKNLVRLLYQEVGNIIIACTYAFKRIQKIQLPIQMPCLVTNT